jgi:YD repeat-containing protein
MPLAATRCYRSWENRVKSFGRNATLSWDLYPTGSRQPYTFVDMNTCDGNPLHFDRISKGTGYADAVYEHRATATAFLGSRFSWNGNGWDLKLRDGSIYVFPESYHAKKPVDGALIHFRDAKAQAVKIERTDRRTLKRLTMPDRRFIAFQSDSADRIYEAEDDQKRKVSYLYDHGGRLVEVRGLKSLSRYEYESTYLMKIEENGRRLVEFEYERQGRLKELNLPDGRRYRFEYDSHRDDPKRIARTTLTTPEGSVTKFDISQN